LSNQDSESPGWQVATPPPAEAIQPAVRAATDFRSQIQKISGWRVTTVFFKSCDSHARHIAAFGAQFNEIVLIDRYQA